MQFRACQFKEEVLSAWYDKDPLFFPQGGGFSADGCLFMPINPWGSLHGIGGNNSGLIPPRFVNCAFVTNHQSGQPIPTLYPRWFVGEFKNFSTARPIFADCKTDMNNGDPIKAVSFVDSFNSAGADIRWGATALPERKEIINYSAQHLIDLSGKSYSLKNISTYIQTTYLAGNASWNSNKFTFDTTLPAAFAVGDVLFYGDGSLPLAVESITGSTVVSVSLFGAKYYDTSAAYYGASGFRISICNAQFINSGFITGDITSGSNVIVNCSNTSAFRVGDFIGTNAVGSLGFPANTRITVVNGGSLIVNNNATLSQVGVAIGNLVCVTV